jgi:hypothetical protein
MNLLRNFTRRIIYFIKRIHRFQGLIAHPTETVNKSPTFTITNNRTVKNKTHEIIHQNTDNGTKSILFTFKTDLVLGFGTMTVGETGFYLIKTDETIDSIQWETNETRNTTQHKPIIHLTDGTQLGHTENNN